MAKKTIKVGLKTTGTEPAAGDVNISYKGSRIAGLSESSTAVLETENTIVQDDIEVEYNKPTAPVLPPNTVPVLVRNQSTMVNYTIAGSMCKSYNNQIYYEATIIPDALQTEVLGFIGFEKIPDDTIVYALALQINDSDDMSSEARVITPSIGTVAYEGSGAYVWLCDFPAYPELPENITLTITDKT